MNIKSISKTILKELKEQIDNALLTISQFEILKKSSDVEIIQMLYITIGNINKVVVALNASDFKIKSTKRDQYRSYNNKDITEILNNNADTKLGCIALIFFEYNCNKIGWKVFSKRIKEV